MFKLNNKIGDHTILSYDTNKHPFVNFLKKLFNIHNLNELHKKSSDYNQVKDYLELGHLNDRDTDLHKIFYEKIKSDLEFKLLYCKFIKDIHQHFYPDQECIL